MDYLTLLKAERDKLSKAIDVLEGSKPKRGRKPRRKMSKAAKARIARAMKRAWKKRKGGKK